MAETLSHKFIEALLLPRDRLYGLALAKAGTPAAAEAVLLSAARQVFGTALKLPLADMPGAMEKALAPNEGSAPAATPAATDGPPAMPADVWARLAAAVQMEAVAAAHPQGLNPDSSLLQPDPMLAPKKRKQREEDEPFALTSPLRVILMILAALLAGVLLTVYIMTRPQPARPSTHPAAPQPAPATTSESPRTSNP